MLRGRTAQHHYAVRPLNSVPDRRPPDFGVRVAIPLPASGSLVRRFRRFPRFRRLGERGGASGQAADIARSASGSPASYSSSLPAVSHR